jgi:hypothetical protein
MADFICAAGIIFYMDIIVPLVGFVLLALQHRYGRPVPSPQLDHAMAVALPRNLLP